MGSRDKVANKDNMTNSHTYRSENNKNTEHLTDGGSSNKI